MTAQFPIAHRAVLTQLGVTDAQLTKLEAMGISSKEALSYIDDPNTYTILADIDASVGAAVLAWATGGSTPAAADTSASTASYTPPHTADTHMSAGPSGAAAELQPINIYGDLIDNAKQAGHVDAAQIPRFRELHAELQASPDDTDTIFNFARIITIMMQPALDQYASITAGSPAAQLVDTAEGFYNKAIGQFAGHGRARVMYGMQLSQQSRFAEAIPHLERAMTLPEGSEEWMIAANWYILSKINLGDTYAETSAVFYKFRDLAPEGTYYAKMSALYEEHID